MTGVTENISHSMAEINDNGMAEENIHSAITNKLNISGHMLIWTFFLVLVCGTRAQNLSTAFSYTLYLYASLRAALCGPYFILCYNIFMHHRGEILVKI
jgi:hypothetical protein